MSDETTTPARFRIGDIHPAPDEETLAAITAALDAAWPEPAAASAPTVVVDTRWRFGLRSWNDRPIPRRTWGASPR